MPMEQASTPQHCPGFQSFKSLSAFTCNCPECGEELEIFSDEFNKPHTCPKCKKPVDFSKCSLEVSGRSQGPR
ncbi:MAG: hypothetical protein K9K64_04820 [Desulfohalobiaceae bacterium]|nr:hypothetical protein [Desulfohalobiaceae bacterium]MCF8104782.1 hypothetical protein [Desulfohalobiaceae bacterium]